MSETYGVRLPPQKYQLTAVDFDLLPNKPPPQDVLHLSSDGEDDEAEDDDEGDEAEVNEAMDEDPLSPRRDMDGDTNMLTPGAEDPMPVASMDSLGLTFSSKPADANDSDSDDGPDGLFEDDDEDEQEDDDQDSGAAAAAGGAAQSAPQVGDKRKLNEDDEYD